MLKITNIITQIVFCPAARALFVQSTRLRDISQKASPPLVNNILYLAIILVPTPKVVIRTKRMLNACPSADGLRFGIFDLESSKALVTLGYSSEQIAWFVFWYNGQETKNKICELK